MELHSQIQSPLRLRPATLSLQVDRHIRYHFIVIAIFYSWQVATSIYHRQRRVGLRIFNFIWGEKYYFCWVALHHQITNLSLHWLFWVWLHFVYSCTLPYAVSTLVFDTLNSWSCCFMLSHGQGSSLFMTSPRIVKVYRLKS